MNSKNKTSNTLPYSKDSYMQNVSVFLFFLELNFSFFRHFVYLHL